MAGALRGAIKAIDGPGNTLLHDRRTEIQQESELPVGEPQVSQNLFLVGLAVYGVVHFFLAFLASWREDRFWVTAGGRAESSVAATAGWFGS